MKFFNQNKILSLSFRSQKIILIFFLLILSIGLFEALVLSPEDYLQGDAVRIMYVHVPAAWMSLGIFSFIAFLSILVFIFKNKNFILIAKSIAPSGFIFNIIALVTGSIWGKPTWGTWWAWDARITSMLILALFYLMYLMAWRIFENKNYVLKVTSLIAIFGSINVPIVKFSVDWWSTLHQPASVNMDGYGLYVFSSFIFTFVSFAGLYLIIKSQLIKEQKKFKAKFGSLTSDKVLAAKSQKINKEILAAGTFSKI